jgi:hypothetical protein
MFPSRFTFSAKTDRKEVLRNFSNWQEQGHAEQPKSVRHTP